MKNWNVSSIRLIGSLILTGIMNSTNCFSNEKKYDVDSLKKEDFNYRIDLGFSALHILSGGNPKYHQHFYLGVSKNNPRFYFTPGLSFLYSNSRIIKDSLYYSKKISSNDYFLSFNLTKNNYPKKEKANFYYGFSLGFFYSKEGRKGSFLEFAEDKSYGFNLVPLAGIDLKILKNCRMFVEAQLGFYSKKTNSEEYLNGVSVLSYKYNPEILLFAFIPLKFGLTFIL